MATPPTFSAGAVLTAAQMNAAGMWHLNTTSFSGATQVDFTDVFTSDYDSYKIVFHQWQVTQGENHFLRLSDAGGVISTADYLTNRNEQSSTTLSGVLVGGGFSTTFFPTYIVGTTFDANAQVEGELNIYRPNQSAFTMINGQFSRVDGSGGGWNVVTAGFYKQTTVCTGFSLIRNSTATMTGKVSVYGIRN